MKPSEVVSAIGALVVILGAILAVLFTHSDASRAPWSQRYGYYPGDDIARYAGTKATATTPHGVHYAAPDGLDVARLDTVVDHVEACLGAPIDRGRFVVLVPDDWTLDCSRTQQVLPVVGTREGCHDAGCDGGVCHYRAVVAEPNIIVATPSLYLLPDALLRFLFDSQNPWADKRLATCAAPVTGPLDI